MASYSSILSTFNNCLFAYLFFALIFFLLSNIVMFQPPRPTSFVDKASTIKLTLKNGKTITAVYLPYPNAKYTVLFSHGNAEDLGTAMPYLQFYQSLGFSILAYDYPGYGTSKGRSNEARTYEAIFAAYDYLRNHLNIPAEKIIVHGRSVGSGPSIELASQKPIGGLIIESPFVSAYRVYTYIPLFPFDKYINIKKMKNVKAPTLVIHGKRDTIVPTWHGKKIYKALKAPKMGYWPVAGHNDIMAVNPEGYWQTLIEFSKFIENEPPEP